MLAAIINWLSGGIAQTIVAAYKAKLDSENSTDSISAGLAEKDISARQSIVLAEISSRLLAWPRFLIEISSAIYFSKVVVGDKIIAPLLGLNWSTDAIGGDVGIWVGIVFGGMFGASIADRITSRLVGR